MLKMEDLIWSVHESDPLPSPSEGSRCIVKISEGNEAIGRHLTRAYVGACKLLAKEADHQSDAGLALLYLLRHTVELALKDLLDEITLTHPKNQRSYKTHNLSKLMMQVENHLEGRGNLISQEGVAFIKNDTDADTFRTLRCFVGKMHNFDETSEKFRYPRANDGKPHRGQAFFEFDPAQAAQVVGKLVNECHHIANMVAVYEGRMEP